MEICLAVCSKRKCTRALKFMALCQYKIVQNLMEAFLPNRLSSRTRNTESIDEAQCSQLYELRGGGEQKES